MKTKKWSSWILGVLMVCLTAQVSIANPRSEPGDLLRNKVVRLLHSPSAKQMGKQKVITQLRLYVNRDREVVVLDTGTENSYLDEFIKHRLNYQVIKNQDLDTGLYNIKITFEANT